MVGGEGDLAIMLCAKESCPVIHLTGGSMDEERSAPDISLSSTPEKGGGAGPEVIGTGHREGFPYLPLPSCNTQESGPCLTHLVSTLELALML